MFFVNTVIINRKKLTFDEFCVKITMNINREVILVKNKTDKAARFIKAATWVVISAAIVLVFIRNAFPETKQAVVIEEVSSVNEEIPVREAALLPEKSSSETMISSSESAFSSDNKQNSTETSEIPQKDSDNSVISSVSEPKSSSLININKAPAGEIVKLDGIGETKAAAIIRYRNENGGFKSVDDLINVSGIGQKTLEKIRDYVTI